MRVLESGLYIKEKLDEKDKIQKIALTGIRLDAGILD